MADKYEEMARKYIERMGSLFKLYPLITLHTCEPPEVEWGRYVLACLVQPENRADLDALVRQADLRANRLLDGRI